MFIYTVELIKKKSRIKSRKYKLNYSRHFLHISKYMHETYGDLVRLEVPARDPMVFLYHPDYCEKILRQLCLNSSRLQL